MNPCSAKKLSSLSLPRSAIKCLTTPIAAETIVGREISLLEARFTSSFILSSRKTRIKAAYSVCTALLPPIDPPVLGDHTNLAALVVLSTAIGNTSRSPTIVEYLGRLAHVDFDSRPPSAA